MKKIFKKVLTDYMLPCYNVIKERKGKGIGKMRIIKTGEVKVSDYRKYKVEIVKETEKAIQVKITEIAMFIDEEMKTERTEWLPKSQIEIIDEFIIMPKWLARKKGLPTVSIFCKLNDSQLKEKYGIPSLTELTAADRVKLLQNDDGFIRVS
jgi:hypothetical protein